MAESNGGWGLGGPGMWIFGVTLAALLGAGCGDDAPPPTPDASAECSSAADCDDGVYCNGSETCEAGVCRAGSSPCSVSCVEDEDRCVGGTCADADGDGHEDAACGGDDCDDTNADRFPSNTEVCDAAGVDEDCDDSTFGTVDADGDGAISDQCCNGASCGGDCDDSSLARRPGQLEICDSVDNDCDGSTDEEMNDVDWYDDQDGDGFGGSTVLRSSCVPIPGASLVDTDCEDGIPQANPAGSESCNGVDDDCDGSVDEGLAPCDPCVAGDDVCDGHDSDCDGSIDEDPDAHGFFVDADGDGVGTGAAMSMMACVASGFARRDGDCDDTDPSVGDARFPELCDMRDNDCDGATDEGLPSCAPPTCDLPFTGPVDPGEFYFEGDSLGNCGDFDGGTPVLTVRVGGRDPDVRDEAVLPSVASTTAGTVQADGRTVVIPRDTDVTIVTQLPDGTYATITFRWNDAAGTVTVSQYDLEPCSARMAADEAVATCDRVDQDCDGSVDEGVMVTVYTDNDGDGAGDAVASTESCGFSLGSNEVLVGGDCDDFDARRSPTLAEVCDGSVDEDCDSMVDEDPAASTSCAAPMSTASCNGGACQVDACTAPFEDCDADASNGCEADIDSSNAHCGACDTPCLDFCTTGTCADTDFIDVAHGPGFNGLVCFAKASGAVYCESTGAGGSVEFPEPTVIGAMTSAAEVAVGFQGACAIQNGGELWCWGTSAGIPMTATPLTAADTAVRVPGVSDAVEVAMGRRTCVRRAGGSVLCAEPLAALMPLGPTDAVDIDLDAGDNELCVARSGGTVVCQPRGTEVFSTVAGISGATQVAVGGDHACAIVAGGAVSCWGEGSNGQLGDGRSMDSATPVAAGSLTGATVITAGSDSTCAVASGSVWCWGYRGFFPTPTEQTTIPGTVVDGVNPYTFSYSPCVIYDTGDAECL